MKPRYTIVVIGDRGDWKAEHLASLLVREESDTLYLCMDPPLSGREPEVALIGNGDCLEVAERTMGMELARWYWAHCERSAELLTKLGAQLTTAKWISGEQRSRVLLEESCRPRSWQRLPMKKQHAEVQQDARVLGKSLSKSTAQIVKRIEIATESSYGAKINIDSDDGVREIAADFCIVISEWQPPKLFEWLRDKWLTLTLPMFQVPRISSLPEGIEIHHLGADLIWTKGDRSLLWSYRSLFDDQALGIHAEPSVKALAGWERFLHSQFPNMEKTNFIAQPSIAALSCDGLPICGPLPFAPTTWVLGAWAGKANGLFTSIGEAVAEQILRGAGAEHTLAPASPKRFC